MNAQLGVQRSYSHKHQRDFIREQTGYLALYDLQIARQNVGEMDINDFDPKILRSAYRRIYTDTV